MECDLYYHLYNFLDIDTAENLAMSSKMTYDCIPIKYKDIIKFKYLLNRMNYDFYNRLDLYELYKLYGEDDWTCYECICGYEFHRCEAHNHFYSCVTLEDLQINVIGDSICGYEFEWKY